MPYIHTEAQSHKIQESRYVYFPQEIPPLFYFSILLVHAPNVNIIVLENPGQCILLPQRGSEQTEERKRKSRLRPSYLFYYCERVWIYMLGPDVWRFILCPPRWHESSVMLAGPSTPGEENLLSARTLLLRQRVRELGCVHASLVYSS